MAAGSPTPVAAACLGPHRPRRTSFTRLHITRAHKPSSMHALWAPESGCSMGAWQTDAGGRVWGTGETLACPARLGGLPEVHAYGTL